MRWVGKTTIWMQLAKKLWLSFYDLDDLIKENIGMSIFNFVEKNWWDEFRKKEHENLIKILEKNENKVLSLGWWAITFENNQNILLKKADKLIYLECSLDTINERIKKDEKNWNKRNTLTDKWLLEELKEIYEKRKNCYESFYDYRVQNITNEKECVDNILKKINYWRVCIPIVDFEKNSLKEQVEIINNTKEIKIVELRIDFIEDSKLDDNILDIIKTIKKLVITTNRSHLEWWKFEDSYEKWIEKIKKVLPYADYIDIELQAWKYINELKNILNKQKLILSYHNFLETPDINFLINKINEMNNFNPDIFKIAVMPKNKEDLDKIYKLQKSFAENYKNKDFIFISMWELWKETRIEIPKRWWILTFWALKDASAPGQINYKELYKEIYKVEEN